jgi:tRNA (adenine57-N1/adenine58-N1)-methyltransferase
MSYRVEERDVYEGIEESDLDRIVLDLPEPWRVLVHAEKALRPGGILLAYLPTINQVATLRATMTRSAFGMAETSEILRRTWHVEERSVRPDHRMVGHTGFLTTARLLVPYGDSTAAYEDSAAQEDDGAPVEEDDDPTPPDPDPV